MKILIAGKGGREHALVTALAESASATEVYCWPGSDAIFEVAKKADAEVRDVESLVAFMLRVGIDLCVGGEESYLALGLADASRAAGIPCFGPVAASAQLEASKEFAKEFMVRHAIPTGGYTPVETAEEAKAAITGYPTVLKFDGLAAGKGVAVCLDESEADAFLQEVLVERKFGAGRLLVEEYLEGPEVSVICAVADGKYQIFTPARDYKRIGDGDAGPNTGGMGAVASRVLVEADVLAAIEELVVKPSVDGLVKDGMDYRGFLYCGLMLTKEGPKIIEYNCRFGDPEAEAVLPLVRGDFAEFLFHAAKGDMRNELISFDDCWSVCLILASAGYPVTSRAGDVISGLEDVSAAKVYHAGTKRNAAGEYETNGGRVLAIVAQGADRESALETVYAEMEKVSFDGAQSRSDIGRLHFV
jgi:phosphoribosylamine--glycine ligase